MSLCISHRASVLLAQGIFCLWVALSEPQLCPCIHTIRRRLTWQRIRICEHCMPPHLGRKELPPGLHPILFLFPVLPFAISPPGFSLWFGMGKLCRLNILIWSVGLAEWDPLGQLAWYWAWRPPMNLDNFPHDSITHHLPCYIFICLVPRPLKVNGDGRVLVRWMYL